MSFFYSAMLAELSASMQIWHWKYSNILIANQQFIHCSSLFHSVLAHDESKDKACIVFNRIFKTLLIVWNTSRCVLHLFVLLRTEQLLTHVDSQKTIPLCNTKTDGKKQTLWLSFDKSILSIAPIKIIF